MAGAKERGERDVAALGEVKLIERIRKKLRLPGSFGEGKAAVVEGIGDDAAVLRLGSGGKLLLLTCDTVVEGVHFRKGTPAEQIGWKAMACNLSDVGAMGGMPRYAVVSVACPADTRVAEIDGIYAGMREVGGRFGAAIVGGDTVESQGGVVVTVALVGEVEERWYVRRDGARAGDAICVTGSLGGSVLGKHLAFTPRVAEGRFLARNFRPSAMIDVSDGLGSDLMKVMEASHTSAEIVAEEIPVSEEAMRVGNRNGLSPKEMALWDGEDFELLFTMAREKVDGCLAAFRKNFSTRVTVIGKVKSGRRKPVLIGKDGRRAPIEARGYEHFRRRSRGERCGSEG